jgi:3-methyladenine DNA glycosylase AlkD
MLYSQIESDLKALKNPEKIDRFKRFFKTGPGQYGEGDEFFGLTLPQIHSIERKYWKQVDFNDIKKLLTHPIHEFRTLAVMFLSRQFAKADSEKQKQIYNFYLANTARINNWDLVDISAPKIVGTYLLDKPRHILYKLAKSKLVWDRRIAIISTFAFIRANQFSDTIKISENLLSDKHDLIHKAVGWALREVGKRDLNALITFLDQRAPVMPRTTLRYSLEKLPESKRQHYLSLKIGV